VKRGHLGLLIATGLLVWAFWPRKKGPTMFTLEDPVIVTSGDGNAE
jgi:hypothetical protein